MLLWAVNLCVISCQLFFYYDSNTTITSDNIPTNYYADLDAAMSQQEGRYSGVADWFLPFVSGVCKSCNEEWQESYVNNASQYTNFLLFTRKSGENYSLIDINDTQSLISNGFNTSLNTKLLIHGWLTNGSFGFAKLVRKAYLEAEDVNVIAVNWPALSLQFYTQAYCALKPVGQYTAKLVDFLINQVGITASSLHVIGHSLGAHIAGFTGKYVTFGTLSRITGLDPAGPLIPTDSADRLDKSDANFVDVMHTCAGYLGYLDSIGTIDFYPNGGYPNQPGCGVDVTLCAHRRSYILFAESITSLGFIGTECEHWYKYKNGDCSNGTKCVMGEHVDTSAQGDFYLYTNGESPYAAWNESLSLSLFSDMEDFY